MAKDLPLLQEQTVERNSDREICALWDASLDPLFWRAERTGSISAWWGHVPFAFWLMRNAKPQLLVELGTHTGVSYAAFCEAVIRARLETRCFAIDSWKGDEQAGRYGEEVYEDFLHFHDERYSAFSTPLRTEFDDAVEKFENGSIDLLHIDGLHTYTAVKRDFESWLPKLSDRAVVLLHDIHERQGDFGVWKLWFDLKQRYSHFEFYHGHGLGVLAVGKDTPTPLLSLVTIDDPSLLTRVRERFAFLGDRWVADMRDRHAGREIIRREEKIGVLEGRLMESDVAKREQAEREQDLKRSQVAAMQDAAAAIQKATAAARAEARARMEICDRLQIALNEIEVLKAERERLDAQLSAAAEAQKASIHLKEARLRAELDAKRANLEARELQLRKESRKLRLLKKVTAVANKLKPEISRTQFAAQSSSSQCIDLIRNSDLFDAEWYLSTYPDARERKIDPAAHYLSVGRQKGYHPGPRFDAEWYTRTYDDVRAAGVDPLVHYLQFGAAEGRQIRPLRLEEQSETSNDVELERQMKLIAESSLFDADWYRSQYPDIANAGVNPLLHYVQMGAREGRSPGPYFDASWYLKQYPDVAQGGTSPLLHYLEFGHAERRQIRPVRDEGTEASLLANTALRTHYVMLEPLAAIVTPATQRRLNLVTDSINSGSLYGGVGTALILSALLAKRTNAQLRIVTRTQPPNAQNVAEILRANNIEWENNIETAYAPQYSQRPVAISEHDYFITTSWWTTKATAGAVEKHRIMYLLQEDERMFYAFGDERVRCHETLSDPGFRFLVNSELLFQHLTTGPEPLPNLQTNGRWFEPAFPATHYYLDPVRLTECRKKNFFFYARPRNVRNLYWRGLEALTAAMEEGVLTGDEWNFYFVGRDLEDVLLPGNVKPILRENLNWPDYAALVRQMDLALCLMDTPHPSYPPLDLAASGAVVLTNRHGLKVSLERYSANIIVGDTSVDGLAKAFRTGVSLAGDAQTRLRNYEQNNIQREWAKTLDETVETIAATLIEESV